MIRKLLAVFLYLMFVFSFAQSRKIDSLRRVYHTKPSFDVANDLGWEFIRVNIDSVYHYNQKSKKFILNDYNQAEYENLLGKVYMIKADYKNAEIQAKKTIAIAQKNNNIKILSSAYNTLLTTASRTGNLVLAKKYAQKNVDYSLQSGDRTKILNAYLNYGSVCLDLDDVESMKKNYIQAKKYFTKENIYEQAIITKNLGLGLNQKGDYQKSNQYLLESENFYHQAKVTRGLSSLYNIISTNYIEMNKLELAQNYLDKSLKHAKTIIDSTDIYYGYTNLMFKKKDFPKAKEYLSFSMREDAKMGNKKKLAENYFILGKIENSLKNFSQADANFRKSVQLAEAAKDSLTLTSSVRELLANKLDGKNNAYYKNYFEKYTKLLNKTYHKERIKSILELDVAYDTEKKNEKINVQEKIIYKEKKNKTNAYLGLALLGAFSFGGFWFLKNRQKRRELQTQNTLLELRQTLNEKELQNLNTQLDPHEIKNFLAHISLEIQEKAPESYRNMIKLFNITKASLNSNSITDSIENQLQQINDFLNLEKSTLSEPLEFTIDNKIENSQVQIPRLMLKNLVENSVKHGIKGKQNGGNITIELTEKDNYICIFVDDTGKGRKEAMSTDSGIGTTTYQKLFSTLNHKNKEHATFNIIDKDAGTKVEVKIPVNYKYS